MSTNKLKQTFLGPISNFHFNGFCIEDRILLVWESEDLNCAPDFSVVSGVTWDKSPFSSLNQEIGPQGLKAFLAERAQLRESMLTLLDPVFSPLMDLLSTHLLLHPGSAHGRHILDVF